MESTGRRRMEASGGERPDGQRPGVPDGLTQPLPADRQGSIQEIDYEARHYINAARQLVSSRFVDPAEAGREVVRGEPIRKRCSLYLPAGYEAAPADARCDVLYLLHGVGGDHREWLDGSGQAGGRPLLAAILDRLIAAGDIRPTIVVFPNGRSAVDWTDRSFNTEGTNMLGFYYFDYELRHDLIPFIDARYRTKAAAASGVPGGDGQGGRSHRALAGLSMGGMQALNLGLGGFRHDSAVFAGGASRYGNGLVPTVPAPGMTDLFSAVGAFSNAPTSSGGQRLGASIRAAGFAVRQLMLVCGDEDLLVQSSFEEALDGLEEAAGERLGSLLREIVPGGKHDFGVWTYAAYRFLLAAFGTSGSTRA